MKIMVNKTKELLKATNKANLVKVSVQVNGKKGVYQSHRWKNPTAALNILKETLKNQKIVKNSDDIEFINKKTGKNISEKELLNEYKKEKSELTLQEYVKQGYKVKESGKSKANISKDRDESTKKEKTNVKETLEHYVSRNGMSKDKPKLQGSEKQIKWAEDLRDNIISNTVDKKIKYFREKKNVYGSSLLEELPLFEELCCYPIDKVDEDPTEEFINQYISGSDDEKEKAKNRILDFYEVFIRDNAEKILNSETRAAKIIEYCKEFGESGTRLNNEMGKAIKNLYPQYFKDEYNPLELNEQIIDEVLGENELTSKEVIEETNLPKEKYFGLRLGTKKIESTGEYRQANSLNEVVERTKAIKNEKIDVRSRAIFDMLGFQEPLYVKRNGQAFKIGKMSAVGYCSRRNVGGTIKNVEFGVVERGNALEETSTTIHEGMHGRLTSVLNSVKLRTSLEESIVESVAIAKVKDIYDNGNTKIPAYLHQIIDTMPRIISHPAFTGVKSITGMGHVLGERIMNGDSKFFKEISSLYEESKKNVKSINYDEYVKNTSELDYQAKQTKERYNIVNESKLNNLVEMLKNGTMTMSQALISGELKDTAAFLLFVIMDDEEEPMVQ